jgi:hypothetical protein
MQSVTRVAKELLCKGTWVCRDSNGVRVDSNAPDLKILYSNLQVLAWFVVMSCFIVLSIC